MTADEPGPAWRPGATPAVLRRRAELLASVRAFFHERGVLEVETPLLGDFATPDAHIASFGVLDESGERAGFLQFSPEFAMKRLLCAGSGAIYQLGKAFRGGESGRWHNPEFTMLEWYRPGLDHHQLMDEVDALLARVCGDTLATPQRLACAELGAHAYGTDLCDADDARLRALALAHGLRDASGLDRTDLLDYLLARAAGERFARCGGYLIDFPPEQSALARLGLDGRAQRFELYLGGLEVANGYHELRDAAEARRRMTRENERRRARGRPERAPDERLLAAMQAGLPASAGVALGVDRLLAVLTGASCLADVLAFGRESA